MRVLWLTVFAFASASLIAGESEVDSRYDLSETADRFVSALQKSNVSVLTREHHTVPATGATEQVIVFQNPYYGTSIGACHKGARKDLPWTARVRNDGNGKTYLAYPTPEPIVNSFGVIECGNETEKLRRLLNDVAFSATE